PRGVEDGSKPTASIFVFGGDDIGEGTGTFLEDEIVELFGVCQTKGAKFRRQGIEARAGARWTERSEARRVSPAGGRDESKGDQEVGHGEKSGFLLRAPELLVESA